MLKVPYRCGDKIVLKMRTRGSVQPHGTGEVVAVLPENQGVIRYRIRIDGENFDRSIGQDDIDNDASSRGTPKSKTPTSRGDTNASWIDLTAVRTKK